MKKCIICVLLTFVLLTGTMFVSYEKAYAGPEVALAPLAISQPEIALLFAAAMGVVIIANPDTRKAVGQAIYDTIDTTVKGLEKGEELGQSAYDDAWERAQSMMRRGQNIGGSQNSGQEPQGEPDKPSGNGFGGYGLAASIPVLGAISYAVNKFVHDDYVVPSQQADGYSVVATNGQQIGTQYLNGQNYSVTVSDVWGTSPIGSFVSDQYNLVLVSRNAFGTMVHFGNGADGGYYSNQLDSKGVRFWWRMYNTPYKTSTFATIQKPTDISIDAYMEQVLNSLEEPITPTRIDTTHSVLNPYTDTTGLALTSTSMDFTSAIQNSSDGTAEGLLNDLANGTTTVPQLQNEVQPQTQVVPTASIPTPDQMKDNADKGQYTDGTSTGTTTDSDSSSYKVNGLKRVFPFCIPFDIYDLLTSFVADPEAPHIHVPFPFSNGFDVDLSAFNSVAQILRDMEVIVWIAGLMYATHKYIKW